MIGWTARSSIYFTSLNSLYSIWKDQEIVHQVASLPCLIAWIKTDDFEEAIGFVDKINGLEGNPVKNRKKYIVIDSPNIDTRLMQNKTLHVKVHVMSKDKAGMFSS